MAGKNKRVLTGKMKTLDELTSSIIKKHGKTVIAPTEAGEVEFVSSNILGLDWAMGGGLPRGRIIEIYGHESSGKSSLALHFLGRYAKKGLKVWYIDAEYAFDPLYAKAHGVNPKDITITQPENGEQALQIVEDLVESNLIDLVVIDSVSALVPKVEVEGEIGDSHVGLQARMMSQALRKLAGKVSKSKATVIFINQIRVKIGVMFGNPETTSGGNALKFYSSIRMEVKRIKYDNKECPTSIFQRIKIIKNKVSPPFRSLELEMKFKTGYDTLSDLVNLAEQFGIIQKSGSWYNYKGNQLGQGTLGVKKAIVNDAILRKNIIQECKEILKG